MKTSNQHSVRSKLLRRFSGFFEVQWFFWGSAVCLGCVVFLSAASLYPLWMLVKPRPTTVAQPLLNTPLELLAPWLAFLLIHVPDMLLLFVSGVFAGFCVRRLWLRWLSTCVAAYAVLSVAFGGSIWEHVLFVFARGDPLDLKLSVLCLVIVSAAYAGALVAICLRSPNHPSGSCPKCGYSLYGLPTAVCPECGRPFSPAEALIESDGVSKEPDRLSIERRPGTLRRAWIAKPILLVRISVVTLLVGAFYAWDWMPLRVLQRDVTGWSVRVTGYSPVSFVYEGSPALSVEGKVHYYLPACTYLDLLMIVAPFVWVIGASRRSNILRLAIAAVVILGGNLIRIWAAVYFNVRGADWFYAHELPDYIIWWPTVAVVVLLALRRDFPNCSASTLKAHTTGIAREGTVGDACVQA